jgi:hypothetical protein
MWSAATNLWNREDDGAKGHRLGSRQRESSINQLLAAASKLLRSPRVEENAQRAQYFRSSRGERENSGVVSNSQWTLSGGLGHAPVEEMIHAVAVSVAVAVAVEVAVAVAVDVAVAVGVGVGAVMDPSNAPTSQAFCPAAGRGSPRWSVAGHCAGGIALIAGLVDRSAIVCVGPPLF